MLCVDCDYRCESPCWDKMKLHYKIKHPEVKRPDKYYTKESRLKAKEWLKVNTKSKIKKSKQKTKEVRSQKKIATVRKRRQ